MSGVLQFIKIWNKIWSPQRTTFFTKDDRLKKIDHPTEFIYFVFPCTDTVKFVKGTPMNLEKLRS